MPSASVNGITVNYLLEGEGPDTVVLVNGLADDLETWDSQVPALLEAGYKVLRYDNRGVGRTSVRPADGRTRHRRPVQRGPGAARPPGPGPVDAGRHPVGLRLRA